MVRTSTSAGVNRIRLTTAELPPQDVEIRGTASAPSQVTLQTDSLETVASGTVTVTVQVRDAHGNAVADVPCNSRRLPLLPRSRPQHCGRMHRGRHAYACAPVQKRRRIL